MKKNYEIKCKLSADGYSKCKELLSAIKSFQYSLEKQKDIYYKVNKGRLKLRIINDEHSNLIFYNREEKSLKRISNYLLSSSNDHNELEEILGSQFKILIKVNKKREIYIKKNIRIHLDLVKGLGKFLEIEVIYDNLASAKIQMEKIINFLNLSETEFIKVSYSDLLNKKN